jgi:hypothetical protein
VKGQTPGILMGVFIVLGLLWFTVAGPATCRTMGGNPVVTVQTQR